MRDQQVPESEEPVKKFRFSDIRATEEHEKINGVRFVRRKLYNGEMLICETLTIANGFWLSKKLDLPKILTQLCDQIYSHNKTKERSDVTHNSSYFFSLFGGRWFKILDFKK